MTVELSRSAKRVQDVLLALGMELSVVELPATTRTAAEAAATIGCSVEQIAKSVLFRKVSDKKPIMVVASGANRVNELRIAEIIGEPIEKADAHYVREKTGFVIGGVPPVGHVETIYTIIDEDLLKLDEVWAAAGTPNSVFRLVPSSLVEMTSGDVRRVK